MTILVLELHIPLPGEASELGPILRDMWPVFLSYVASFINLGIYWVGQNNQFHYVRYTDRILLWLHLFFLLFVTILPFSTALLGRYPSDQLSEIVYGTNLVLIGFLSYTEWWYATLHHRLVVHDIKQDVIDSVKRRILFAPLVSIVAILLSFLSVRFSVLLYIILPPYYIWPRKYDENWHRPAREHDHDASGQPIL